jgi:hypothetical protein
LIGISNNIPDAQNSHESDAADRIRAAILAGKEPFNTSCLFGRWSFKYKMQAQNPAHAQNGLKKLYLVNLICRSSLWIF